MFLKRLFAADEDEDEMSEEELLEDYRRWYEERHPEVMNDQDSDDS